MDVGENETVAIPILPRRKTRWGRRGFRGGGDLNRLGGPTDSSKTERKTQQRCATGSRIKACVPRRNHFGFFVRLPTPRHMSESSESSPGRWMMDECADQKLRSRDPVRFRYGLINGSCSSSKSFRRVLFPNFEKKKKQGAECFPP